MTKKKIKVTICISGDLTPEERLALLQTSALLQKLLQSIFNFIPKEDLEYVLDTENYDYNMMELLK